MSEIPSTLEIYGGPLPEESAPWQSIEEVDLTQPPENLFIESLPLTVKIEVTQAMALIGAHAESAEPFTPEETDAINRILLELVESDDANVIRAATLVTNLFAEVEASGLAPAAA